jgi:carboxymethylenebutenolidase
MVNALTARAVTSMKKEERVKDRLVDIRTPGGAMETFITHPSEGAPFRPVIVYMDMWGVREELYDLARRIAVVGYYCIVPDLYYRFGKYRNVVKDASGKQMSFTALPKDAQERQLSAMRRLTDQMAIDDTAALLEFMDKGEPVRPGPVGSIGYCLGGRLVLCATGAFPSRMRAGASLHGVELVTDRADSPQRLAQKGEGELYCGHAEKDRFSNPEVVRALEGAFKGTKVKYFHEIHKGADHGYALPDRDVYDKQAANRDMELIFAMWRRQLPFS